MLVAEQPEGKKVEVEVWRNRSAKTLAVGTTQAKAEKLAANDDDAQSAGGRLGVAVRPMSAEEKAEAKGKTGLVVEQASGPARRAGIQPGDVLLSFNGTPLKSVDDLRERVSKAGKSAALLVQREDQQLFVAVELG
jgi:serine protease Do